VVGVIRNFLECGGGILGGYHQFRSCEFGSCGFDTRSFFFFDFPAGDLEADDHLGSGFLGLAVFPVEFSIGCLGSSMTDLGEGFPFVVIVIVTLTTHQHRASDSAPRASLSAPQKARPAALS
jgi:hypothetical protein